MRWTRDLLWLGTCALATLGVAWAVLAAYQAGNGRPVVVSSGGEIERQPAARYVPPQLQEKRMPPDSLVAEWKSAGVTHRVITTPRDGETEEQTLDRHAARITYLQDKYPPDP